MVWPRVLLFCPFLSVASGWPQSNAPKTKHAAVAGIVEAEERATWDALKTHDRKALAKLMDDDFVGVESDGIKRGRDTYLKDLDQFQIDSYTLENVNVTTSTSDVAIIAYRARRVPPNQPLYMVSVCWAKRGGAWKVVHHSGAQSDEWAKWACSQSESK